MGNRVVKFRGKRIDTEDWVTGFYAKSVNDRAYIIVYATEDAVNTRNEIDFLYIEVIPETAGQYTGTIDKNGKEIYEGDIVLTDEAGWVGHVIYGCDCFMVVDDLGGFSSYCNWEVFEVIGNIHDKEEQP